MAPHLSWLYEFVADSLGRQLGCAVEMTEGVCYSQLETDIDLAFVCGLAYVVWGQAVEPLAAPVLMGNRYAARPIYFSEVIVHRDSGIYSFADLRGRSWTYNEPYSQSGYGIMRFHLAQLGETQAFFSRQVEAGWHEVAIRLVADGEVDAAAVDSHVWSTLLLQQPDLAARLRIIACLGPSPIPPVVAARHLPESVREALRNTLLALANVPEARAILNQALIARFVPVEDATYEPIRQMRTLAEVTP